MSIVNRVGKAGRCPVRVTWRRAGCALLALLFLIHSTIPGESVEQWNREPVSEIAGSPGIILQHQAIWLAILHAKVFRVLYESTGLHNEPIAVSGVVIIPDGPAPRGGRPIVAWAHPTSGLVQYCAPSLHLTLSLQIQGLQDMLRRGYIVAATDYPGLGTPGLHPYLIGESEGRAVLDSVRAARNLAGATASDRVALWGHSQGGQAVLFAARIAQEYAPELKIVGVAAAAPATDLVKLLEMNIGTSAGKDLIAMTIWSWSRMFGPAMNGIVDRAAIATVDDVASRCIQSPFDMLSRYQDGKTLQKHFLKIRELTALALWRGELKRNSAGTLPTTIPVFLTQGAADRIVPPEVTRDYMARLCTDGSAVRMLVLPRTGHSLIAHRSAGRVIDWIADRFEHIPAPSDCGASLIAIR